MKKLLGLICGSSLTIVCYAESFYCPDIMYCDSSSLQSCRLIDKINPHLERKFTLAPSQHIARGNYVFDHAEGYIQSAKAKKVDQTMACTYRMGAGPHANYFQITSIDRGFLANITLESNWQPPQPYSKAFCEKYFDQCPFIFSNY